MMIIRHARFPDETEAVREIWREFVTSPSVSLDYQGYEAELADLPGKYAQPRGCVLLAQQTDQIAGCISMRRVSAEICEMKRLYVRPHARGSGLGYSLIENLIREAKIAGYAEMRLDVLAEFEQAKRLYRTFGFVAADPVSFNPLSGTAFLGLRLV